MHYGISLYHASLPTEDSRDDVILFRAMRSVWTNTVCRRELHPSTIPAPRTAVHRSRGKVTEILLGEGLKANEDRGASEKTVRCKSVELCEPRYHSSVISHCLDRSPEPGCKLIDLGKRGGTQRLEIQERKPF